MIEITVKDATPELMQKMDAAIGRFVKRGADYIESELHLSMGEGKSGRTYGSHIASAPGESPAVDSSNLDTSITQLFPSTFEALIGTPVEYAVWLEDGTDRGLGPRPLWEKTAKESLPTLEKLLNDQIRGV